MPVCKNLCVILFPYFRNKSVVLSSRTRSNKSAQKGRRGKKLVNRGKGFPKEEISDEYEASKTFDEVIR